MKYEKDTVVGAVKVSKDVPVGEDKGGNCPRCEKTRYSRYHILNAITNEVVTCNNTEVAVQFDSLSPSVQSDLAKVEEAIKTIKRIKFDLEKYERTADALSRRNDASYDAGRMDAYRDAIDMVDEALASRSGEVGK